MNAYLLSNVTKPLNSTKFINGGTYHDVTLKQPCNILAPVIIYKLDDDVLNHNYLKLQFAGWEYGDGSTHDWRYYFLTDKIMLDNNRVECHYAEDVMGTYRRYIKSGTQYVSRATLATPIQGKSVLDDALMIATTAQPSGNYVEITNPFQRSSADKGCYMLGLATKHQSPASASAFSQQGSVNYYLLDTQDIATFVQQLQQNTGKLADINPMQYIVSCMYIPLSISTIDSALNQSLSSVQYSFRFYTATGVRQKYTIQGSGNGTTSQITYNDITLPLGFDDWYAKDEWMRYEDYTPYSAEAYEIMRQAIIDADYTDPVTSNMLYLRWHAVTEVEVPSEPVSFSFHGYKPSSIVDFPRVHGTRTINGSNFERHPQANYYQCLNGNPYTKTVLNLMPFGSFPIDLTDYASETSQIDNVRVEYDIDLVTGHGTIQIGKSNPNDTDFDYIEYTSDTTVGVPIQISSTNSNSYLFGERSKLAFESGKRNITYSNVGATLQTLGGVGATVTGALSGNAMATAQGVGQTTSGIATLVSNAATKEALKESYLLDKLQNAIPQVYYSGSNGSFSAFQQNWSISQTFKTVKLPDNTSQGYLVMDREFGMSDAIGFVKCVTYKNSVPASMIEKDAISSYMISGAYLE